MSSEVEYPERPISEQLVDLHVYVVPTDLWRDHLNSAINTIINETVSAGFVRVLPESSVYSLREELEGQLGYDIIPREYVFLKSVGRCLTRIRPKQEFQLKVKNFLPPLAYVPEVFLLEASPEYLSSYPSSGVPSGRNSRLDTGPSEFNPHKPMPPIRHSNAGSVQNGHDSSYSTAGTQTGYSNRSTPPLTHNDSNVSTNYRKGPPDSVQNTGGEISRGNTQAWAETNNIPRGGRRVNDRHFSQLTPVAGSEPPGHQSARETPNDYSIGKGSFQTTKIQIPPPGIQVTAPSVTHSRNSNREVESYVGRNPNNTATWADRSHSPSRGIEVQTDNVHSDIVLKSYRSEAPDSVRTSRDTFRHPSRDPSHDPSRELTRDPPRDSSYDPSRERTRDPQRDQSYDPSRERMRGQQRDQSYDPSRERMRDPQRDQSYDPSRERMRDPQRDQSYDPSRERMRDPQRDQSYDPSRERTRDPQRDQSYDTSRERTRDPQRDQSYNRSREPSRNPSREPSRERMVQGQDLSNNTSQSQRDQQNYSFAPTHDPNAGNSTIDPRYGSYRPPQKDGAGTNEGGSTFQGNSPHRGNPVTGQVNNSGASGPTTGYHDDRPYPQYQQHSSRGPQSTHPYNAQPATHVTTSHSQNHPNTSHDQPNYHSNAHNNDHSNVHDNGHGNVHSNGHDTGHSNVHGNVHSNGHSNIHSNGHGNAHNNGHSNVHSNGHYRADSQPGSHPGPAQREPHQRELDDERNRQGYEPPLSASPPNSAGQNRVTGRKTGEASDQNKYNNTSDDSGISEMDEADRRRAEERLRGQSSPREPGAEDSGQDRRQDLLELERRRQEVVDRERRQKEEEQARWQQWGGGGPEDRKDSGLAGSDAAQNGGRRESNPANYDNDEALDELLGANDEPVDQQELKAKLMEDLEDARAERKETEKRREDLVKRAKAMQNKTQQRRTQARDLWKKRYFEEKKKTAPLEEQATRMRQELEALHRKIMSQLEQTKEKDGGGRKGEKPSAQSNLKIQATKYQHEIEDLQRRVENVKMKLTSEMKLRNQAETELRALRAELTQKKINMSLNRSKISTQDMSPRTPVPATNR